MHFIVVESGCMEVGNDFSPDESVRASVDRREARRLFQHACRAGEHHVAKQQAIARSLVGHVETSPFYWFAAWIETPGPVSTVGRPMIDALREYLESLPEETGWDSMLVESSGDTAGSHWDVFQRLGIR